jgi:hypothetical protein
MEHVIEARDEHHHDSVLSHQRLSHRHACMEFYAGKEKHK